MRGATAVLNETEINREAPIVLHQEIEIAAVADVVWGVLSAIEAWPTWNPDVASALLQGELKPGTSFHWRAGGSSVSSQLVQVAPAREIAWTGRAMGVSVIHVYRLEARDGATVVRTDESVEGLVARLFRRPLRARMDKALIDGLRCLCSEAERRAGV